MSIRIKDFLYDFLKDKHVAIYHIQSKDLHNYYKKYCAEKSFSNVEVEKYCELWLEAWMVQNLWVFSKRYVVARSWYQTHLDF